ncbi:hypothetical protein [Mesorhizobium sp. LSHC412B00]|uniref:hypothetical protein n=1 Tax=Mesorhizobium sp. LSHC412B00 TaxID=1287285 RepID=UPI0003CE10ED|nr:hypothetical protein [Mesorhizobium sp. LSHC412B00]ESX88648.1 hypothetical protein X756_11740 [Mesorhizobium sp. LSHC412B00]
MTTVQQKLHSTPAQRRFSLLVHEFSLLVHRRRGYVDVRELSPHLQRDMGFLDGNDPSGRCK